MFSEHFIPGVTKREMRKHPSALVDECVAYLQQREYTEIIDGNLPEKYDAYPIITVIAVDHENGSVRQFVQDGVCFPDQTVRQYFRVKHYQRTGIHPEDGRVEWMQFSPGR